MDNALYLLAGAAAGQRAGAVEGRAAHIGGSASRPGLPDTGQVMPDIGENHLFHGYP
jgi:hypothetical protein